MMTPQNSDSPTIRDVARLAKVSVATVSRYLNQTTFVSEETARRVQEAMAQLDFTPQAAARNLATHRNYTIGLLLTEISGDFFTPLLKGIESVTREEGYGLLISTTSQSTAVSLPVLGPQNTDGILVFLDSLSEESIKNLVSKSFPVVLIHQTSPEGLKLPCVTIENKSSLIRVVEHLVVTHQRRHIAFLRGPEGNEDSCWREEGYLEALKIHGIPYEPDLTGCGGFDRSIAYEAVRSLLRKRPDIDAIFTGDDEAAFGAMMALRDENRRIPEDVSVVGFDDQSLAPYLTPPLTTVHAPTENVGIEAARQLIRLIKQGSADPLTLLPTNLIFRRSCGCDYQPTIAKSI